MPEAIPTRGLLQDDQSNYSALEDIVSLPDTVLPVAVEVSAVLRHPHFLLDPVTGLSAAVKGWWLHSSQVGSLPHASREGYNCVAAINHPFLDDCNVLHALLELRFMGNLPEILSDLSTNDPKMHCVTQSVFLE